MKKTFQAVYGSWVGSLIAAGRSDEDIHSILHSSAPGLDTVAGAFGELEAVAAAPRARAVILAHLPTIRKNLTGT